jgi:hypothetical protein
MGYDGIPPGMGLPCDSYLVGNVGDGTINVYNSVGLFLGKIRNCQGSVLVLNNLWSLIPGTIKNNSCIMRSFYFSAGVDYQTQGLIGYLSS